MSFPSAALPQVVFVHPLEGRGATKPGISLLNHKGDSLDRVDAAALASAMVAATRKVGDLFRAKVANLAMVVDTALSGTFQAPLDAALVVPVTLPRGNTATEADSHLASFQARRLADFIATLLTDSIPAR